MLFSFYFFELRDGGHTGSGSSAACVLVLHLLLGGCWLLDDFGGIFGEHFIFLNCACAVLDGGATAGDWW